MTEIPEHLLKRSKERRAALGLGEGEEAASAAPAAEAAPATEVEADATPAGAVPAAPAPPPAEAPPEPPKQVPASVAAFQRRRRVPYWAMPVLAALPIWAYVYQGTLEPPPAGEGDPVALGEHVYADTAKCAACHGASGGGGTGPALDTVVETWPDYRDHIMWVRLGSDGWPGDTYGANDTQKRGGMPAFADTLTDAELAQVVLYERTLAGADPADPELADLLAVALGEKTLAEIGLGELSQEAGVEESELGAG